MQFTHITTKFLTFGAADRQYALKTRQKHRDCFASWLLPALGTREIESIELIDALTIRNAMQNKRLSSARISSVLSTLKALLNFSCTVLKLRCKNPAEIKLPPKPKPDVKFLTDPNIARVRAKLNPHRFTDRRTRAYPVFFVCISKLLKNKQFRDGGGGGSRSDSSTSIHVTY